MQRLLSVTLLMVSVWVSSNANSEVVNVDMFAGEVKVLGTYAVDRVAVGNGKVVRVENLVSGELLIIAQDAGSSSLKLWQKEGGQLDFNIRVSEKDPQTRIRMEKMIRMSVKVVEVRKSAIKELGINWSDSANGPAFSTVGDFTGGNLFNNYGDSGIASADTLPLNVSPFSTHFGIATSITSRINFLAANGDAITLAEPMLSSKNGGSAKFLAGGEIPYPVTGSNGQTSVEFKEYGIKLEINPFADANNNVSTKILTEVSQIDPSVTVLGAPGLLTRRTETEINVVEGKTIVISGLLNAESSEDIDKVPGLGDIPYLGALFRSKSYRNQATELVIFVTPEVMDPVNSEMSEKENNMYSRRQEMMDEVRKKVNFTIME
jgi:pilus assembly protein CpaC